MEKECHLLTTDQVGFYWPLMSQQLDTIKHVWELWWTKEALREAIVGGYLQCWVIGGNESISLVILTQIVHYPANTMLKIVLAMGNKLDEYYDIAEATLEKFAIDRGCRFFEAMGRVGWGRRIPGVKNHGTVITRAISGIKVQ